MTSLRTKLLSHLKYEGGWCCKIALTRREFRNPKGNLYSPEYIGRELRHIYEDMPDRVEKDPDRPIAWYRYIKSGAEHFHEHYQKQNS